MSKIIVLCHGCFDLLHVGHVRYLQAAKAMGDMLIVTITADKHINKGEGRPIWNEHRRAEMVAALKCVDRVMINDAPDVCEILTLIKPSLYVKGKDYKGVKCHEFDVAEAVGAKMVFTNTEKFSTTDLIERIRK